MKFVFSMIFFLSALALAFYFGYKIDFSAMDEAESAAYSQPRTHGGVRIDNGAMGSRGMNNTPMNAPQINQHGVIAPSSTGCIQGARC